MKKELWFANNDMLYEVLPKLSAKDLLKLKCVSKGWQRLMSDLSFIRIQLKKMEPLTGFFYQGRYQWCNEDYDCISFIPISRITAEVHIDVLDFLPESIVILHSSYGLICCRISFPCHVPVIYICNPVNKEWKVLQWPNPSRESCITLLAKMKLARKEMDISLCNHNMQEKGSNCVQGTLYWVTDGDQILIFDTENEISWLIMVPPPPTQFNLKPEMCIGETEGKLHFVLLSEHGLQLWVLNDQFTSQWEATFTISL
ncbi:unnamed protein product [Withania somnifera]